MSNPTAVLPAQTEMHNRLTTVLGFVRRALDFVDALEGHSLSTMSYRSRLEHLEEDAERVGDWMQGQVQEQWERLPERRREALRERAREGIRSQTMKKIMLGVFMLAVLGLAVPVAAQTNPCAAPAPAGVVINPTTLAFLASADHATTLSDGQQIVTRYEFRAFRAGTPTQVGNNVDLGKPTPDANGCIVLPNPAFLVSLLFNVELAAKVAAIGPAGEGLSPNSNPFARLGPPAAPTAVALRPPGGGV